MSDRSVRDNLPLALVMGACGGMGTACARRMGQRYEVVLADIDGEGAQALANRLRAEGFKVRPAQCDITDATSVSALFAGLTKEPALRALVHVVGLSPAARDWRHIVAVNLQGARRVAEAALPAMCNGVGVFVSSLAAHAVTGPEVLHSLLDAPFVADFFERLEAAHPDGIDPVRAYSLSKYALNRMCRRLAAAWTLGFAGYAVGLVLSTALDLPSGPVIVWVLVAFALGWHGATRPRIDAPVPEPH